MTIETKKPIDIPTRETSEFIASNIPAQSTILEIGCGEGHVGAELTDRGIEVTGIDPDSEAVENAAALGGKVIRGSWPDVTVGDFNAIAFTRSLHHIEDLTGAVEKAADVLREQGIFLLEDFAFNVTDQRTLDWFLKLLKSEPISSLVKPEPDEFAARLLLAGDPMDEWKRDQHHDLHSAEEMRSAIKHRFEVIAEYSVPYFYRYLVPVFPKTSEAAESVDEMLLEENRLGASNEIVLVGRRIVAVKK